MLEVEQMIDPCVYRGVIATFHELVTLAFIDLNFQTDVTHAFNRTTLVTLVTCMSEQRSGLVVPLFHQVVSANDALAIVASFGSLVPILSGDEGQTLVTVFVFVLQNITRQALGTYVRSSVTGCLRSHRVHVASYVIFAAYRANLHLVDGTFMA